MLPHEIYPLYGSHCPTPPSQADPIGELLALHFPEVERIQVLTVDNVTMDVQGLRKLVVGTIPSL